MKRQTEREKIISMESKQVNMENRPFRFRFTDMEIQASRF